MSSTTIHWGDLTPSLDSQCMRGGGGFVYKATLRRGRAPSLLVAVKLLKVGLLPRTERFDEVADQVEAEAHSMEVAMQGDMSESVAKLCGVVRGSPPQAWLEAIGAQIASVLSASPTVGGCQELLGLVIRWEEGGSLADLLHNPERAWGGNTAARLQLCHQLAVGLCHLHTTANMVHADIKSDNVLLSDKGAHPRPMYTDFGISALRKDTATTSHTAGEVEGTAGRGSLAYMAVEMFPTSDAEAFPATRTTDVFALGTLFWEVLTGRQPWKDVPVFQRVQRLLAGEGLETECPPLPLDTPVAVKDLLALCMGRREDRPKAEGIAEVLAAAVAEMAAKEYDVFLSHAWVDGRRAPLTNEVYLRLSDTGLRVWVDTDMGLNFEASMREGVARSKCVVALMSQRYSERPNCLKELRYAKDMGKVVVGCCLEGGVGSEWWNSAELKELIDPAATNMPNLISAAGVDWEVQGGVPPEEREKLTKGENALPKVLQLIEEAMRSSSAHGVAGGHSSDSGSLLVGGGAQAQAVPHSMQGDAVPAGQQAENVQMPGPASVTAYIVSGSADKTIFVRDAAAGERLHVLKGHEDYVNSVCTLGDGRIVSGSMDKMVRVWDVATGESTVLKGHAGWVQSVCALRNGRIVSGSADTTVRVWNVATKVCERVLVGHKVVVESVCALEDGRIVSGSRDGSVRVWDSATEVCVHELKHKMGVESVCALGGGRIVSGCRDKIVRVWDAATGECVRVLEGHADWVMSVCALRDGRIVSGCQDGTLRVWDVTKAEENVLVLTGHKGSVEGVCALGDGRIVSGSVDQTVRMWDATTGTTRLCLLELEGHDGFVLSVCSQ